MGVFDQGTPLSVTANTQQGPIKLEISLNSRQSRNEGVEMGVQTGTGFTLDLFNSMTN